MGKEERNLFKRDGIFGRRCMGYACSKSMSNVSQRMHGFDCFAVFSHHVQVGMATTCAIKANGRGTGKHKTMEPRGIEIEGQKILFLKK